MKNIFSCLSQVRHFRMKKTFKVLTQGLVSFFVLSNSLCAEQYFFQDGDHLKVEYSENGPTLLKIKGAKIKQILDSNQFEKFVTDHKSNLFLSNIKGPQAFFLVFEQDKTLCIELASASSSAQQTHHLNFNDIDLNPDFIAKELYEGKTLPGFETRLELDHYNTESFFIKKNLQFESSSLMGQKIHILNMTNTIQNFQSLIQKPEIISFYSEKSTLHPGESTDAIILYRQS